MPQQVQKGQEPLFYVRKHQDHPHHRLKTCASRCHHIFGHGNRAYVNWETSCSLDMLNLIGSHYSVHIYIYIYLFIYIYIYIYKDRYVCVCVYVIMCTSVDIPASRTCMHEWLIVPVVEGPVSKGPTYQHSRCWGFYCRNYCDGVGMHPPLI